MRRCRTRNCGSGVVIVIAFAFLLFALAAFILQYGRVLGTNQEQRTAVEAATLAAAGDLSRIVVEDPYFGFISISDAAPVGAGTKAGDNYFTPVRSINTILATIRLDLIIADNFNNGVMKSCCQRDYNLAQSARVRLTNALTAAIAPDGFGTDLNGKPVYPYKDAVAAYQSNLIKMSGNSQMKPNSLKLTLGWQPHSMTCTPVPAPFSIAALSPNQSDGTYYCANVNIPYDDYSFVFASTDTAIDLVDNNAFSSDLAAVGQLIPGAVRCEADQTLRSQDPVEGNTRLLTVHCAAAATFGSEAERQPAAGALALDCPAGTCFSETTLLALISDKQLTSAPTDYVLTAVNEDSPPGQLCPTVVPAIPPRGGLAQSKPPFGAFLALGFYDWMRCAGPVLNVSTLATALNTPLDQSQSAHTDYFQIDSAGNVQHFTTALSSSVTRPISQNQLYAVSGLSMPASGSSSPSMCDVFLKDNVYQPGRVQGGEHAGQPLPLPVPPCTNIPLPNLQLSEYQPAGSYPRGPSQGGIRPTYTSNEAVAVDILIRPRT